MLYLHKVLYVYSVRFCFAFIIKFRYNVRSDLLKKRALWEYKTCWRHSFAIKKEAKIVLKIKKECVGNLTDSLYRKSSIKPPSQINPPSNKPPRLFSGGKLISPPSLLSPLPQSLFFTKQLTINVDWSVMVYSRCKFILFLIFGHMTSNFICLTFSTLRSSSLWRIVTIFL